jgi:hypothetical protein
MPEERVRPLQLGVHPEAAISGGLLLQSEEAAFLLFNAMADEPDAQGCFAPAGTAVLEFTECALTRFGSPNDEGRPEHPLYPKGLAEVAYAVCEVEHSAWARQEMARARRSAECIWGDHFARAYAGRAGTTRHFLVAFHDSTFECLADDVHIRVTVRPEPYHEVVDALIRRLLRSGDGP